MSEGGLEEAAAMTMEIAGRRHPGGGNLRGECKFWLNVYSFRGLLVKPLANHPVQFLLNNQALRESVLTTNFS